VKDGRIEQTNFDSYDSMRISAMPKVDAVGWVLGRRRRANDLRGSPGRAQRIFAATGQRIRSFPLKNHNMRLA
jgi:isoquinoline 1-oxidoreductase beta subunit